MNIALVSDHALFWNGGIRYMYEISRRLRRDNEVDVIVGQMSNINKVMFGKQGLNVIEYASNTI